MATLKEVLQTQFGGSHYADMKIQPIEYILENNLGPCEANIIKYVSRWRAKDGVRDLQKARHYIDILLAQAECAEGA